MNPQDLITQVRAPGGDDSADDDQIPTHVEKPAATIQKAPVKRPFCSFFCCGYTEDDDEKAVDNAHKTASSNGASTGGSYPERGVINSPRASDGAGGNGKATAPWRDDHLLPPPPENKKNMKCLVLDLDETLVHSSFKPVEDCDFVIPVEIENQVHKVYVSKRPYVDDFMKRCGELYEVVVFTASLAKYADPVLDLLDIHKVVDWRLFRESCSPFKGSYVKDMGRMGRDLNRIMIVDNSPHSYAFNPENAIPVESWFSDKNDTELMDMIPVLEKLAAADVTDCKETLRELHISGLEALKREFQGGSSDEEYSTTDDEYSSESGTGYETDQSETDNSGSQTASQSGSQSQSASQSASQSVSQSHSQSNSQSNS